MKKTFVPFLISLFSVIALSVHGQDPFDEDLEFAYKTLLDNHPGFYNDFDPTFSKKLEEIHNFTKEKLSLASDEEEKKNVLRKFGQSFEDSHLWLKYDTHATPKSSETRLPSFEICEVNEHTSWVRIPTFYPYTETQKRDFQTILEKLPTLRNKTIVFDVRGNRGGSYTYGTKLIECLYGKAYVDQQLHALYRDSYEIWRVSRGNLAYLDEVTIPFIKETFPEESNLIKWCENLSREMTGALHNSTPFVYKSLDFKGCYSEARVENTLTTPVYVIVDRHCYSATLMFIDELKGMNSNLKLVGESTGADSIYMELRVVTLPSGDGKFGFPMYVYKGPIRGHNIPHHPDIKYRGDLTNTQEIKDYILNLK